jgi:hypothetical protein
MRSELNQILIVQYWVQLVTITSADATCERVLWLYAIKLVPSR